jgi:hypothetical protein
MCGIISETVRIVAADFFKYRALANKQMLPFQPPGIYIFLQ